MKARLNDDSTLAYNPKTLAKALVRQDLLLREINRLRDQLADAKRRHSMKERYAPWRNEAVRTLNQFEIENRRLVEWIVDRLNLPLDELALFRQLYLLAKKLQRDLVDFSYEELTLIEKCDAYWAVRRAT